MTVHDHMMAAEAQLLMADVQTRPNSPESRASAQLHTAMVHLEFALAIVRGESPKLPEPAPAYE